MTTQRGIERGDRRGNERGGARRHGGGHGLLLAGALSALGLSAMVGCSDEDSGDRPGDAAADAASNDGEEMGAALAAQTGLQLAGEPMPAALAHLGAILLAIDGGALAQADLALERADDTVVQGYAAHMMHAHSAHADSVEYLLASRGVGPIETPISGTLRTESYAGMDQLRGTPRHDLDFAYMRLQVKMHAAGGVLVNRLFAIAPDDAPLRELLDATRGAIAAHRSQAEAILRSR
jgi:predicted outer membrane protein